MYSPSLSLSGEETKSLIFICYGLTIRSGDAGITAYLPYLILLVTAEPLSGLMSDFGRRVRDFEALATVGCEKR